MQIEQKSYKELLNGLKERIRQSKVTAALSVNFQLLNTYWEIGKTILTYQKIEGWGAKIVARLAKDLKDEFPEMKGFSSRNFSYMRAFAEAYPHYPYFTEEELRSAKELHLEIVQAPLAQLNWFLHLTLLQKVKTQEEREFYIRKIIENGWSRNVAVHHIERGLYKAQGNLSTNFSRTIAPPDSDLIQQVFKDPYCFDFLQLDEKARERDLENALLLHIQKVLLELGQGFSFVGNQYRLELSGQEYFLDLLFYHIKLHRYIVIELKMGEFIPEFAGKMNFYLGLVDDNMNGEHELPAIGLILCKQNNRFVAEYALRDTSKPIGIAEYLVGLLPEEIQSELPTIAELEGKLEEELIMDTTEKRMQSVKEKLRSMQTEELKIRASHEVIDQLFDQSIQPFLEEIAETIKILDEDFITQTIEWGISGFVNRDLREFCKYLRTNKTLGTGGTISMYVSLEGLKKGGRKQYTNQLTMKINFRVFVYEFTVSNYNQNQPFLIKQYDQKLSIVECKEIKDIVLNNLLDQIELAIQQIELGKES